MRAPQPSLRDALLKAIAREYSPLRSAAEYLARAANKTPRAAKNWLSGTNAPDAEALIELMASCSSIADEVERLVAERRAARELEICRGLKSNSDVSASEKKRVSSPPYGLDTCGSSGETGTLGSNITDQNSSDLNVSLRNQDGSFPDEKNQ